MVGAGDWLRRVIYRGLRIGGMVYGIRAEARFCAVRDLPDHRRCAGARLRGKGGRIEKKRSGTRGVPSLSNLPKTSSRSPRAFTSGARDLAWRAIKPTFAEELYPVLGYRRLAAEGCGQ